jgi:signal transduction histidine kinase
VFKSLIRFIDENLRLSPKAFFLYAPASILGFPVIFLGEGLPASLIQLLLMGTLVTALTFGIYICFLWSITRYLIFRPATAGMIVLLLTGIARGLLGHLAIAVTGFESPTTLLSRVFNSVLNIYIWAGLGSIVLESNRRFLRRYRAIMTQILTLRLRESSADLSGYSLITEQISTLQRRLQNVLADTSNDTTSTEREIKLSKALRIELEQELKPLSQRLWIKSVFDPPHLRVWTTFKTSITSLQLNIKIVAPIYSIILFLNTVFIIGLQLSMMLTFFAFIFFILWEFVRNICKIYLHSMIALINTLYILTSGFVVYLGSTFALSMLNQKHSYAAALFIAPTLSALLIAVSFISLALADRASILEILAKVLKNKSDDYSLSVSRGHAASYLHNSLQSELLSLITQLETAAGRGDPEESHAIIEKVNAFISRSRSEDFQNFMETPELRLARIVESWNGIAVVTLDIDPNIYQDPIRAPLVVQLIEEAIANAVRSGKARAIKISGSYVSETIAIEVRDNGTAKFTRGSPGLGSRWIDSIAVSHWNLREESGERILTVEI